MKKLLPVALLAVAAACTQEPVRVVLKGDQFFGRDQQLASTQNPYESHVQIRTEPMAQAQPVTQVGVSELPPIRSAYQETAFQDTTRPMARIMTSPVQQDISEIQMMPAVQQENTAARFAPAAIQVESPSGASDVSQNWYQGKVTLAKAEVAEVAPVAQAHGENFIWPVRGKIISNFGPKANGLHNDGINIAANLGDPIYAAADGVVVYAGNDLKGYGNMVILRHQNGWMTAYAHANQLMVEQNTRVLQGQRIATVGATGSVESAQLHFGLRNGKTPVDPAQYLGADVASR